MKISVIIPCFNDGQFINEAVDSVLSTNYPDIEIIIVNDGSTDDTTLKTLLQLEKTGIKVLSQTNNGLAKSRNRGIKECSGQYIIPLDADNKIKPDFIKKSIPVLSSGQWDIVYGKPVFFGENAQKRMFSPREFDGNLLFYDNYIDACTIFRKSVWEKTGGYDENMPVQGNEDWEFWLNCFLKGFKFKFIDEEIFEYRIRNNSMIAHVTLAMADLNHNYIIIKHKTELLNKLSEERVYRLFYENDQKNYFRTTLKYLLKSVKSLLGIR